MCKSFTDVHLTRPLLYLVGVCRLDLTDVDINSAREVVHC